MPDDLEALFRNYHGELQALAYRRLSDREQASDVVQDAYLRYASLQVQAGAVSIHNPRHFLWRIVINLVADLRRRNTRRGYDMPLENVAEWHADPQPLQDAHLESRQQLRRLKAALAELPENCRHALLLNRLQGLTHAEIALKLGVSPSMVSKYIMRALKHCARRMAGGGR